MAEIYGFLEESRGLALILLEFEGMSGWRTEPCAIDTAFTETLLFTYDRFHALTGREPRLSNNVATLGDGRRRNLWEETITLKWFREEIEVAIFTNSPEAPKELYIYPLIGIKLLARCVLTINYPDELVTLKKRIKPR